MNEYVKAQELAVLGFPLDKIDVIKAALDKAELTVDQINLNVVNVVDRYISEHVAEAYEKAEKAKKKAKK